MYDVYHMDYKKTFWMIIVLSIYLPDYEIGFQQVAIQLCEWKKNITIREAFAFRSLSSLTN